MPNVEAVLPEEDGSGGLGTSLLQRQMTSSKKIRSETEASQHIGGFSLIEKAATGSADKEAKRKLTAQMRLSRQCFTHTTR